MEFSEYEKVEIKRHPHTHTFI